MSDSTQVVPIFVNRAKRSLHDFMRHADLDGSGERRVVWYKSQQRSGSVTVLISWEAQCAVARSTDMTTDEIFGRHAGDFDRQIGLLIMSKEQPRFGPWTLDACDIVPII